MNCPRCGTAATSDSLYCSHCALPLGSPAGGAFPHGYAPMGPPGPLPNIPDYLVWSIIMTIFCQPIGIASIIFSVLTMSDRNNGRYDSALRYSQITRQLLYVGLAFLILLIIFYIVIFGVAIFGAILSEVGN